jgi:RNA polymerase sigma-70 factor, ECF subfamily
MNGNGGGEREPDRDDVAAFCRREWPRLIGTLSLYLGDDDLAQEFAQETLARICRDWRKVSRLDAPGAWAHRVALNLAHSHFRRRVVARRLGHRVAVADRVDPPDTAVAVAVRAALALLPERQRVAVVLRFWVDLSVADTAAAMRCAPGTVKSLTHDAIANLRAAGLIDGTDDDEEQLADVE